MVEAAEHLDAVALVVGVAVGELLEVADLLLTRTAHHLVGALHLVGVRVRVRFRVRVRARLTLT